MKYIKTFEYYGSDNVQDYETIIEFPDGYKWVNTYSSQIGKFYSNSDTILSLMRNDEVMYNFSFDEESNRIDGTSGAPDETDMKYILQLLLFPNITEGEIKLYEDPFKPKHNERNITFKIDEIEYKYPDEEEFSFGYFNKEDFETLYKKRKDLFTNEFELNYLRYKRGVITMEDFVSKYKDLVIVDGNIDLVIDGLDSLDKDIFKKDRDRKDYWQYDILCGDSFDLFYYDSNTDFDYSYNWDDLNVDALKEIREKCLGKTIRHEDDEFELTAKNLKIIKNKLMVKTPSNVTVEFDSILSDSDSAFECDDVCTALNIAQGRAQSNADETDAHNSIINAMSNKLGDITFKHKDGTHIRIDLDLVYKISKVCGTYKTILEYVNNLENLEDDTIEVDVPYNGWYGSITSEDLSYQVIEDVDYVKINKWIRKQVRKFKHKPIVKNARQFPVAVSKQENDILAIEGLKPKDRPKIKLTDSRKLNPSRVVLKNNKVEIHCTCDVKISKPEVENIVGVDKGFRSLIASSSGNLYGEKFNDLVIEKVSKHTEKSKKRYKLRDLSKKLESQGEAEKSSNIKINNLGDKKFVETSRKSSEHTKNFINESLNKFFKEEKPTTVAYEDLTFVYKKKRKYNKKAQHKMNSWCKGYIQERLLYKSYIYNVEMKEINAAGTSQTCSYCGFFAEKRSDGDIFH